MGNDDDNNGDIDNGVKHNEVHWRWNKPGSLKLLINVSMLVSVTQEGGDGPGAGRRHHNEKHQDRKGKAICKYYIEGRCTWVGFHNSLSNVSVLTAYALHLVMFNTFCEDTQKPNAKFNHLLQPKGKRRVGFTGNLCQITQIVLPCHNPRWPPLYVCV